MAQVIGQKKMHSDDEWEELHEQEMKLLRKRMFADFNRNK